MVFAEYVPHKSAAEAGSGTFLYAFCYIYLRKVRGTGGKALEENMSTALHTKNLRLIFFAELMLK